MESGYFRYNLNGVERKIIPGKYNFVAQVSRRFSDIKILFVTCSSTLMQFILSTSIYFSTKWKLSNYIVVCLV